MSVTFSPSTATTTASTVPRMAPSVVTYRYQHATGSEMAYVALAGSHEEAQDIARQAFPALLATVDPRWLVFTITIRYKATNTRQEISIAPAAWSYVTSRLVPYRLIDVRVAPPTSASSPVKSSRAPSYVDKPRAPSYTEKASPDAPPYPDSPPPQYPGSPKKHMELHPHLPANGGYGYGFGWHDQTQGHGPDYDCASQRMDPPELADRRSQGWSASSVRIERGGSGRGLFSRIKSNGFGIFPITWDNDPAERRRRRARRRLEREKMEEHAHDAHEHRHGSGSGSGKSRSYVPSLL